MRIRGWMPWEKWDWKRIIESLKDLFRFKKVGLIVYREPPPPLITIDDIPSEWTCKKCGFTTKHESGIKIHMNRVHKIILLNTYISTESLEIKYDPKEQIIQMPEPIEPMHISRIHQPSGVMR